MGLEVGDKVCITQAMRDAIGDGLFQNHWWTSFVNSTGVVLRVENGNEILVGWLTGVPTGEDDPVYWYGAGDLTKLGSFEVDHNGAFELLCQANSHLKLKLWWECP